MRTAIYDYIAGLSLGTYSLSSELPWDQNGQPLYLSNLKRIYVDTATTAQNPSINSLGTAGCVDEVTTVRVFFVNDAKQLPSNYDSLVDAIKQARLSSAITGVIERLCQVDTEYVGDKLVTTFEFSYKKLLTN